MMVRRGLERRMALLGLFALLLGWLGWLAIAETPAAPRLTGTIKPYDPLP